MSLEKAQGSHFNKKITIFYLFLIYVTWICGFVDNLTGQGWPDFFACGPIENNIFDSFFSINVISDTTERNYQNKFDCFTKGKGLQAA